MRRRLIRAGAGLVALWLAAAAAAEPLRIAVISDLNGSYGSTTYDPAVAEAVATIIARRPDLVISTGDMVAGQQADPKLTASELAGMWDAFHTVVSDPMDAAGLPLLVTPGNHDASAYPGYEAERDAFAAAWAGRAPGITALDTADWPFRGAWSLQGVLLVGIDATRAGPLPVSDLDWLRSVLTREGPKHRTVILFGHVPLMPFTQGRETEILDDPSLFALAQETGVDLWLSGHQHAFYSGTAGGILFVAQGALGDGPRKLIGEADRSPRSFTWIEIAEDGAITVAAYPAPGFAEPLPMEGLPATLGTGPYALTRASGRD